MRFIQPTVGQIQRKLFAIRMNTSDKFLILSTYQVEPDLNILLDLYKVLDTCYYNDQMNYYPILLQISEEKIKKFYQGCDYLIQVWDKNSNKVYEIPLQRKFKLWTVTYSFLIFLMEDSGQEKGYIKIVNLDVYNEYVTVQNFGLESEEETQFSKIGNKIDAQSPSLIIRTYSPEKRILGLLIDDKCLTENHIIVVLETDDNQLDFNKFFVEKFLDERQQSHRFEQCSHVRPREDWEIDDPIVKSCFIFYNYQNYALTMRKSGGFDIYWSMIRKDSVENRIQIKKEQFGTLVMITHGRFLSIYEITQEKWLYHIQFEAEILTLFRHIMINKKEKQQCILCKNGAVFFEFDYGKNKISHKHCSFHVKGEIVRFTEDQQSHQTLYVIHKEKDNQIKLSCIQEGKISKIDIIPGLKDNCSVTFLHSRGQESYILIQNDQKQYLCRQKEKFQIQILQEFNFNITGHLHSGCYYDIEKTFFVFDETKQYNFKLEQEGQAKITFQNNIYCIGILNFNKNFNYAICQDTSDSLNPGLRLFDMESSNNKNSKNMLLLKKIDIGTLGYFDYDEVVDRFAFVSSLTHVIVTPILHRNMNKFIGISEKSEYICYNVIKEYMIALDKEGVLHSWNILTGKFEQKLQTEGLNLENYSVVSEYRKGPVLLKSNQKEDLNQNEDKDRENFFPWELQTKMEKQIPFVKSVPFAYHKYRYIEILSKSLVKIHLEYVQPSYPRQQSIFINSECDRMITILANYRTYFYKAIKDTSEDPKLNYKIRWQLVRFIHDFPSELEGDQNRLEYFSPCQRRYLVLDKQSREFIVKNTETGNEIGRIPKDILTVEKDDPNPTFAINKIKWLDAFKMLVVNDEGYEKIIDLDCNFKDVAENFRPLFNEISGVEWKISYYYTQRENFSKNDVIRRMKRIYQNYKTNYFLQNKKSVSENFNILFNVDPIQWEYNEQSFTFLDWSLIEQLQNEKLNINDMEKIVIEHLVYDILPGGNTVFHQIYKRKDQIQKLFEICHPDGEILIHVPVLPNFNHQTFISLCLDQKDYKSVNIMLRYLSLYPIGHHSQAIKALIPIFIEQQLPAFLDIYLDSRFQQTDQLRKINKGTIKKDPEQIFVSEIWFRKKELNDKILLPIRKLEKTFKLEFLDLPGVYHYLDPAFDEIFLQLSETDKFEYFANRAIQKLIEFNYQLIQDWVTYAIIFPFIAFHIVFVVYMNVIYEHRRHGEDFYTYSNWVLSIMLLIFSTYFLIIEAIQCGKQGVKYLTYIWNYIDIVAPIFVIIFEIVQFLDLYDHDINETLNRTFMALSTFFMWLKLLYILRIFKQTGYLIRMIVEVIKDMGIFLFILLLTILAFGDSFLRISLANDEQDQFTTQFFLAGLFAYRMILGDFDTSEFGEVAVPLVWIFFILCTILNLIVMLNLLIAIISNTHARMTQYAELAAYQEMASLICENSYIIPYTIKNSYAKKDKYLVCFTDLEKVEKDSTDPIQDKLKSMQRQIIELSKNVEITNMKIAEQSKVQQEMNEKLDKILERSNPQQIKEKEELIEYEIFWSRIHEHFLQKMTLKQLRKIDPGYEGGFGCDARKFKNCQSGLTKKSESRRITHEIIYHCEEEGCNFDFCEKCYQYYGNAHHHKLQRFTYQELVEKVEEYDGGWLCDAAVDFKGCGSQGDYELFQSDSTVLYHDPQCNFDLCDLCIMVYQPKRERESYSFYPEIFRFLV